MTINDGIDLTQVARELDIPLASVQRTTELFDDGNTAAFIARFRRDQTGGLNEEQVRHLGILVQRLRSLAERKKSIVKSLESQAKLTPELIESIRKAPNQKTLEDIYQPFRPKKQTLSIQAKRSGLEPLALEILNADSSGPDLHQRASEFGAQLSPPISGEDVLVGVRHILAERYSEHHELHDRLLRLVVKTGRLASVRGPVTLEKPAAPEVSSEKALPQTSAIQAGVEESNEQPPANSAKDEQVDGNAPSDSAEREQVPTEHLSEEPEDTTQLALQHSAESGSASSDLPAAPILTDHLAESPLNQPTSNERVEGDSLSRTDNRADNLIGSPTDNSTGDPTASSPLVAELSDAEPGASPPTFSKSTVAVPPDGTPAKSASKTTSTDSASTHRSRTAERKSKQREKRRKLMQAAFKDYFDYNEMLTKVPPHRVLALNRGERAKILRVRIELDSNELEKTSDELLVRPDHPYAEFLRSCLRDALSRLIIPSLEREARRDLTDKAETRALEVFVRNLRNLLLQPPIRGRRILAVDPGFRSGCKMVALDEFGNVLGNGVLHIVGKEEWQAQGRAQMVSLVQQHNLSVVAIGNGAGCRATELLVADCIAKELQPRDIAYVIVNEAGTNEYSTSGIGREELPDHDPTLRSAISIGRRLLDPLSELVKINPANIGVGLYQHDMKAKHLRESLDALVESCVNYVGVDVNTASPALLRYVSGLNQLTARRIHDYRREHGPFVNREQLKQVPGIGEATYIQSAGFLRILGGDNPLDSTWIHPESYSIACRVLESLQCELDDLRAGVPRQTLRPEPRDVTLSAVTPSAVTPSAEPPSAVTVTPSEDGQSGLDELTSALASTGAMTTESAQATPGESPVSAADPEPGSGVAVPLVNDDQVRAPQADATHSASNETNETAPGGTVDISTKVEQSDSAVTNDQALPSHQTPVSEIRKLTQKIAAVDIQKLSAELEIGTLSLRDILSALSQPGRDPREDLPPPIFRRGIMKLEDLQPGMELSGTVLNVVDFGAFVDIGISDSGLVHISRLADRFVKDPYDVVSVGDVLRVWVLEVDKGRRRVSLTAIRPGSERQHQKRHGGERTSRPPRVPSDRRPQGAPTGTAPADSQSGVGAGEVDQATSYSGTGHSAAGQGTQARSQERRPPPRQREGQQRRGKGPRTPKFEVRRQEPKKPKPIVPITKEMEEGRAPLRSFSDLAQFYEKKKKSDS